MQQPRAGAFVSAGVLFIAAAVLMYGHGELTATRAELGAARAHLLALSSRLSALEAASANGEPRMAPERRRAQHEELGGGCLSSDEIAVSALDSAFAVSNALAGFMSNILPGLQSSKVQCDLFAAGVQPELESAAAGFSSFNESVRPGLEEAKEAYEAFAAEEQPQLQLAAEGFNSFNESVRPDLESSKALFDSLHPGLVAFWPALNCFAVDCGSGAVCVGLSSPQLGYTCSCDSGYATASAVNTAVQCIDTDGCDGISCGNAATCTDISAPGTGYTCACTGSGYEGADTTSTPASCTDIDGCVGIDWGLLL